MKKNLIGKMFDPEKTKLFWVYFIISFGLILGGVILMPVWQDAGDWCFFRNWGLDIINIIIAICIFVYLFTFLIKKIGRKNNGVVTILTIIEFILLFVIGIFCILEQFDIFNLNCCQILGLVFYCRGVVEVFRAYYFQRGENNKNYDKYPLWWLIISILFITIGAYLFFASPFDEIVILWTVVGFILLVGICFIITGIKAKPLLTPEQKAKKKQAKKEKKAKKKQKKLEKKAKAKEKEAAKKAKEANKAKAKSEKAKENSK